jgi:small nuclear ribonucleoprotein E
MSGAPRVSKAMTQPLTVIFRFLQTVRRASRRPRACGASVARREGFAFCGLLPPRAACHLSSPAPPRSPAPPQRTRIAVWLYEQSSLRIEGRIIWFDEFMNLVLDDAEEVPVAKGAAPAGPRRALGRILLKGDNVTLIRAVVVAPAAAPAAPAAEAAPVAMEA